MTIEPRLYLTVKDSWDAMLSELEKASRSIDLEHFILKSGGIGDQVLDVLARKAKEGMKVRVLLDGIGSAELAAKTVIERCTAAGIELRFFNSIIPLSISYRTTLFFRDHQKLIVIDGRIGMTGGTCIDERMRDWRDSLLVLDGEVAAQMARVFEHMWVRAHRKERERLPLPVGETRYLLDIPFTARRPAYRELRRAIRSAKGRILLETPYFVPPHRVLRLLRRAASRGVAVSLVLPARSDARLADLAAESYFTTLLKAGIRIYRYEKTTLHAKAYAVDDAFAMLGSHNLDRLSFEYNFEGSVVSRAPALVRMIARSIEEDIAAAREITWDDWQERGLVARIKEVLIFPLRFIL
jgi:cardiolipin synthase A/B